MKRVFTLLALLAIALTGKMSAQNIQFHYDFGGKIYDSRKEALPSINTTLENLSMDKWGQTYMFVDMFYAKQGIAEAYWEIARELKFWKAPIALHLEYNGGVNHRYSMNNAYLAGLSYQWSNGDGSKFFNVYTAYRHDQGLDKPHNMQLTGAWSLTSWNRLFTFNGFADLMTTHIQEAKGGVIFVTEPQAWLNLNQFVGVPDDFDLSLGTEVRMAYNLFEYEKFMVMPTVAVKWTFR